MEGVCRVRFHVLWIQFRLNAPINTNQKLLTSAVTYVGQIYGLDIMHLSLFQNEFMVEPFTLFLQLLFSCGMHEELQIECVSGPLH